MLKDIVVLAILVLLNGFFTCAEFAIISVNSNRIKLRAESGEKKAALLKATIDTPDNFLSTIQVAVSLLSLFSGAYAASSFTMPVTAHLAAMGVDIPDRALYNLVFVAITLIQSYFSLVFGRLAPKKIALEKSEAIAMFMITPISILTKLCMPIVWFLTMSTNVVLKLTGIKFNENNGSVTEEEIRMLVDAGGEIGNIDEEEMVMINNIFEFDDKSAEDICTHRTDIAAIDIDDDINDIIKELGGIKYSRIPVYEENIDNIIGILHVKDIMKYILKGRASGSGSAGTLKENLNIRKILREPYFVPTSKKTDELFKDMQLSKIHIAIVIDEYGGTVGIVTMEDLIEEIMGNIFDEYDVEVPEISMLDQNTYEINGTTSLDLVEETLDTPLPVEEYETLSGFVIGQLGRIPSEDEQPEIEFNGLLFKVQKVEDKRISKLIVLKVS